MYIDKGSWHSGSIPIASFHIPQTSLLQAAELLSTIMLRLSSLRPVLWPFLCTNPLSNPSPTFIQPKKFYAVSKIQLNLLHIF